MNGRYWILPFKEVEDAKNLIEKGMFALGDKSWAAPGGSRQLKKGDKVCFYLVGKGVVAHGTVKTDPCYYTEDRELFQRMKGEEGDNYDEKRYPWMFTMEDVHVYLDNPVEIDYTRRLQMESFKSEGSRKRWGWFVHRDREITGHEFDLLTSR